MKTEQVAIKEQVLNGKSKEEATIALLGSKLWIIEKVEEAKHLLDLGNIVEAGSLMGFVHRNINKYPIGSATRGFLSSVFSATRSTDNMYPSKMNQEISEVYIKAYNHKAKA